MTTLKQVQVCGICGESKALNPKNYQRHPNGYYEKVCKECLARHKRIKRSTRTSNDWAYFLRRYQLTYQFRGTSITARQFDYDMLRAIMRLQNFMCPLSALQIKIPKRVYPGDAEFPGWERWRDSLPQEEQERTPVLVRVDCTRAWAPGNLIFITHIWQDLYNRAGGLHACREMCGQAALLTGGPQQGFEIPSDKAIEHKTWDIKAARQLREHRGKRGDI